MRETPGQLVTWASRAAIAQQQDGERLLAHARRLAETKPDRLEEFESGARVFVDGEPYFLTRPFAELVDVGRATVPDWPLQPHDLVSPAGYVLFEQPIVVSGSGVPSRIRSMTWRTERWGRDYPAGALSTCWFSDEEPFAGGLNLGFGMTAAESLVIEESLVVVGVPPVETAHLLQSLLACLKQHVAVMERARPNRAARRLTARAHRPTRDVHIVSLRRSRSSATRTELGLGIDWATRWWVRSHWRRQACGRGRGERRPVLVASYVKGPEDKPLAPLRPRRFVAHR